MDIKETKWNNLSEANTFPPQTRSRTFNFTIEAKKCCEYKSSAVTVAQLTHLYQYDSDAENLQQYEVKKCN